MHLPDLSRLLFSNLTWFCLKTEKNAFCEKLVGLSEEQRLDPAITESMKRSLEALIESHTNEGDRHNNWQHEMEENTAHNEAATSVLDLVTTAYKRGLIVEVGLFICISLFECLAGHLKNHLISILVYPG